MKILFFLIFSGVFAMDQSWDEMLLYNASFGGVNVATATLKSKKFKNIQNQDILRIEFKAKSKPSLKYIFPINDKIIIDIDLTTWQPIKVDKKIREGGYKQNSISTYDHKNKIFIYKEDSISYDGEIFNPYSLIYYFRTLDFSSNANYCITGSVSWSSGSRNILSVASVSGNDFVAPTTTALKMEVVNYGNGNAYDAGVVGIAVFGD